MISSEGKVYCAGVECILAQNLSTLSVLRLMVSDVYG